MLIDYLKNGHQQFRLERDKSKEKDVDFWDSRVTVFVVGNECSCCIAVIQLYVYIYTYVRKQSIDNIRTSTNGRTHFFIKI